MSDPTDVLNQIVVPLLRGAFEGPADQRVRHLNGMVVTARAVLRFCREVGPLAFPGIDTASIVTRVAEAMGPASKELAGRAGLDAEQLRLLMLAFALGIEAGAEEAGPEAETSNARGGSNLSTETIARVLACLQDLRARGQSRDAIREGLGWCILERQTGLHFSSERERQSWEVQARRLLDTLLASFYPAPEAGP